MARLLLLALFATAAYAHPRWYQPSRHLQDQLPQLRKLVAAAQARLPAPFARRLDGHESGEDDMDCAALTTPQEGQGKAFCDYSAAEIEELSALSANDDGTQPCDYWPELLALMCDGMCSTECQNSDIFQSMSANDGTDNEESGNDGATTMAAACADGCLKSMLGALKAFAEKEAQCVAAGKSTEMSANDDAMSSNSQRRLDHHEDESMMDGVDQLFDVFSFGCTVNNEGENCLDLVETLAEYENDEFDTCSSAGATALINMGCCVGSIFNMFAMHEGELDADDLEMYDVASYASACPGGEALFTPCSKGALVDVTVVRAEMVLNMDMSSLSDTEKKATKNVLRASIAEDLGVRESQVLILKLTSASRRLSSAHRRLASTTVEYQVTAETNAPGTDQSAAQIASKIESGEVKASTVVSKAAANSASTPALAALTTADIAPDTTTTTIAVTAEPDAPTAGDDDDNTTLIIGVVVGVVAFIAIVVIFACCCKKKSTAEAKAPQPTKADNVEGVLEARNQPASNV